MNEDTEYKDAFDAAAQPAVETAEEPSFAGPKQILRTEPRSSKPTLPTTRPQRRMSQDQDGRDGQARIGNVGLSAHAQSAANAVGSGPDMADQFPARVRFVRRG